MPIVDVVFIGHVDAGKSTMGGQLLALTGMVSRMTNDQIVKSEVNSETVSMRLPG